MGQVLHRKHVGSCFRLKRLELIRWSMAAGRIRVPNGHVGPPDLILRKFVVTARSYLSSVCRFRPLGWLLVARICLGSASGEFCFSWAHLHGW